MVDVLLAGIDTLDLGLYVEWDFGEIDLRESLARAKVEASGENSALWADCRSGTCLVYPSAGKRTYRFHVETLTFHAWLFKTILRDGTPDIYVSIKAASLWAGVLEAVEKVQEFFVSHGVKVKAVQPSRCDICADFLIRGGVSLWYLLDHKVPSNMKTNPHMAGDVLETFYIGGRASPIRARLYDKAKEVLLHGKEWFKELWDLGEIRDVWRVEFQLRRVALRSYGIETVGDLREKLGGIWKDLTSDWFCLRALDDPKTSRRSVMPFWEMVQGVAKKLGPAVEARRVVDKGRAASVGWHVNRGASSLVVYAALMGLGDLDQAIEGYAECLRAFHLEEGRDFEAAYRKRCVECGLDDGEGVGDDIPF
ncbi:MAG: replication initiation factor domain-containing protein [Planctomycetaceae bacterium]|nr:replication initiation factor domain-containing protein [Planctomycetaceae bacterium]